ncbi:zinc finger protein jing-like [Macrobrachium rosenbergii]|uniref:zinc finger protein jing-like n=1 Tax=Macrobrachium rosenbergii TaxID=79674 RepID=UPI0034D558B0
MSVSVVPGGRNFHWESASKPALSRCHRLPPLSLPHIPHHHHLHHRHHHHHHHHRPRRRHFSGEPPTLSWPWRSSETGTTTTLSIASSWHAGESFSLQTAESFEVLRGGSKSVSSSPSSISSSTFPYLTSRLSANKGLGLKAPALFLSRDTYGRKMSSPAGGTRSASLEATGSNNTTSTAAAREVKQYLNRTLFPRPSSTLHGYASLYHRLKKLPSSHRKARQRGKTTQPTESSGSSKTPSVISGRHLDDSTEPSTESELEDLEDQLDTPLRCPPRVEIHIYVPTGAALTSSGAHCDDDAQPSHFAPP